ncbi:MAG: YadA-like family protein [Phascolarctobacterium sp.]|nr:YadA-like family protein [Phascolarctobacterium sp.]
MKLKKFLVLGVLLSVSICGNAYADYVDAGSGGGMAVAGSAVANGSNATAVGVGTLANGTSTALGYYAKTYDTQNIAIGYYSVAGLDDSITDNAILTTAVGSEAKAYGTGNTAIGGMAVAGVSGDADVIDATALGYYAHATASNSIALGYNASVTAANSIAIGANAVASEENTVSFGTSTATRKLVNITAGTLSATSTDAVNGSQLYTTNTNVTAAQTRADNAYSLADQGLTKATTNATNITTLQGYFNSNGQALAAVADGAGNNIVDTYVTKAAIGSLNSTTTYNYIVASNDVATNLTTLDSQIKTNADAISSLQSGSVAYTDDSKSAIQLAAAGTTISNVKAGTLSETSTEAVNGSQLHATNTALTSLTDTVGTQVDGDYISASNTVAQNLTALDDQVGINTVAINELQTEIAGLGGGGVKYDDATTKDSVTFAGSNGTTLKNVADGSVDAGSKEAVNGGQLWNQDVVSMSLEGNSLVLTKNDGSTVTGPQVASYADLTNEASARKQADENLQTQINDEATTRKEADDKLQEQINGITNQDLGGRIDKLGREIDSVGALSAALAGLHPTFAQGNKGSFAAAIGTYDGQQAMALGGFYAPTEKIMLSLGAGIAEGGKKMGNLGVSFALDGGPSMQPKATRTTYSRAEVDKMLAVQKAESDAKIQALMARLEALENKK